MPDGSPLGFTDLDRREGEHLVICTGEGSLKAKNTRRDPRIALSIVNFENPYEEVRIRGRVVERRPDTEFKTLDSISHKYIGKPFPMRSPVGRVALTIEVEKARYTTPPFEHTTPQVTWRGLRRARPYPALKHSYHVFPIVFSLLRVTSLTVSSFLPRPVCSPR
jgi:hypothetical protein